MNIVAYFEIQASVPEKAVAFYTAVFGWKCTRDGAIPIEYYRIQTEGMNGAILQRPAQTPPPQFGTNAFTCSIQIEDFDATSGKILAAGGQIAMPKFAIPGSCWQGYFVDVDHNVFGIFEVDPKAA